MSISAFFMHNPISTPPESSRFSAIEIPSPLMETTSTLTGLPHPKSDSYTPNRFDMATDPIRELSPTESNPILNSSATVSIFLEPRPFTKPPRRILSPRKNHPPH
ncbi:hypothetical protein Bca4012_101536 [Brassica carinata]